MADLPPNSTHPATREEWRAWLEQHHERDEGVWLVRYKQGARKPTFGYDATVEEAIYFGWVDSLPRKLDAERSMLYFAPRKPRSGWSRANKQRVARMTAQGRMAPAGLAKVEAAKADGSWSALDEIENLVVPDDLRAALDARPPAAEHFDAFPRSAKRGILEWIATAKRAETRTRRIEETARLAAENVRANQWRRS